MNYLLDAETATADLLCDLFPPSLARPGYQDQLAPVLAEVMRRHLAVTELGDESRLRCGDVSGIAHPVPCELAPTT